MSRIPCQLLQKQGIIIEFVVRDEEQEEDSASAGIDFMYSGRLIREEYCVHPHLLRDYKTIMVYYRHASGGCAVYIMTRCWG